jgi:hypothetical protein
MTEQMMGRLIAIIEYITDMTEFNKKMKAMMDSHYEKLTIMKAGKGKM